MVHQTPSLITKSDTQTQSIQDMKLWNFHNTAPPWQQEPSDTFVERNKRWETNKRVATQAQKDKKKKNQQQQQQPPPPPNTKASVGSPCHHGHA